MKMKQLDQIRLSLETRGFTQGDSDLAHMVRLYDAVVVRANKLRRGIENCPLPSGKLAQLSSLGDIGRHLHGVLAVDDELAREMEGDTIPQPART